ncbi:MAG: ferritin family protein [Candidatus Zixiibacteriota bacterium]
MTNLEGLSKGIQAELSAYVFYKKGLEVTKDDKLRGLLTILAAEEKVHYRILEGQYDSLVRSEMWVTYNDVLNKEGLPNIDERMADVHLELLGEVSETTSPMRILEIALGLEEQARDLYADLAEKTEDPNGKETYEYLVKFENTHVTKIETLMKEFE